MTTADIVLVTILSVIGVVAFLSLLYRMMDMQDGLFVEITIIACVAFFIYLLAR